MSVTFTAADRVGTIGGYIGGIATLLGGLGGVAPMMNGYANGGCGGYGACGPNGVTKDYIAMSQEIAAKDSRIALLEADKYTDQKLSEVYVSLDNKIGRLEHEVRHNKEEQNAVNMNQAVLNGTTGATIACIQNQVAALYGLTKLVVPNTSVCPGWGEVTVTPTTTTAAGA